MVILSELYLVLIYTLLDTFRFEHEYSNYVCSFETRCLLERSTNVHKITARVKTDASLVAF